MCTRHRQHPQGVALQATCTQPKAGQDRHRRWVPRCLRQDRPKGERLAASTSRGFAATLSQRGISLVELIMFIVIVGVALAGILLVMNVTTKGSADPLIHKQTLAIAESLLEEVELMPFTFCDPDDPTASSAATPAVAAGSCTARVEALGPDAAFAPYQTTAETRYSTTTPFDNVNDYNGCQLNTGVANAGCDTTGTVGVRDIAGNPAGPAGYRAVIVVNNNLIPAAGAPAIAATEALLITVTVTGPDNFPVVLDGIRTRYSPRSVP
jgi:MSHA pilin protein MshD